MENTKQKTFDLNNLGGIKDDGGLLREDKVVSIVNKIKS